MLNMNMLTVFIFQDMVGQQTATAYCCEKCSGQRLQCRAAYLVNAQSMYLVRSTAE